MSFAIELAEFAEKTGRKQETVYRGTLIRLFSAVIYSTPVLKGFLRGGWRVQKDLAPGGASADPSGKRVENEVRRYKYEIAEDTYFVNSLPYAQRIEFDGHSSVKAPRGMVRHNIRRFTKLFREEIAKL